MNFMGKSKTNTTGDGGSTRGAGGGGGGGGNSFEEEDEEERQNTAPTGQLFPSSSSSSPSSSQHHHHQYQHQQYQHQQHQPHHQNQNQNQNQAVVVPPFPPQNPYQNPRGSWSTDPPMMLPAPPQDNNNNNNNNNNNDDDQQSSAGGGGGGMMMVVEREHMFDKVVTPSDVGKLNRLVIPKQHAERYFPLDSSTNDKGLLLNFEDRNGKPWRFRYSYWNSSQSYVMTKGWSRFVKDKKLDAGDIVSFQRGVGGSAKDRLFIDWRHRPDAPTHHPPYQNLSFPLPPHHQFSFPAARNANIQPWNPLFLQSQPVPSRSHSSNLMLQSPSNYSHPSSYRYGGGPYHSIGTGSVVNVNQGGGSSGSVIYFRSGGGGGGGGIPHQQQIEMMQMQQRSGVGIDPPALPPPAPPGVVFESVPVVHGKAAAKRLRLFGVNMDCPISDDDDQEYDTTPIELSPTTASAGTTTNSIIPMGNYHQDHFSSPHHHHHPPPSSSTIPYLQLRPYGGEEAQFHQTAMVSSSSTDAVNKTTKSSSSDHMSLDLDM